MSATAEVSPRSVSARPDNSHQQNIALMKKLGATSYNPIPPDQHNWQLKQADVTDAEMKLWSWIVQHTVAHVPGRPRSEYAVDEHSKPVYLEHAARELEWDEANARRTWRRLKARGVGRNGTDEEGKRRVYICGNVQAVSDLPQETNDNADGRRKGKEGLYRPLSPFVLHQVNRFPKEKKEAFFDRWKATSGEINRLQADVVEAGRTIAEQIEDITFSEFGIKSLRLVHKDEKRKVKNEQREARLQPLVQAIQRSVQTSFNFDNQAQEKVCTNPKNESVQTSASLLVTEKYQRTSSSLSLEEPTPPQISTTTTEIQSTNPIGTAMQQYGFYEDELVHRMGEACREVRPDATDEEIAEKFLVKAEQLRRSSAPLRPGLMLVAVPKLFAGDTFLQWRQARQAERGTLERQKVQQDAEMIQFWRTTAEDPDESEQAREQARAALRTLEDKTRE